MNEYKNWSKDQVEDYHVGLCPALKDYLKGTTWDKSDAGWHPHYEAPKEVLEYLAIMLSKQNG